jgi:hypothetical protein
LFKNFERIGIDPTLIKYANPFWTPGNQFDYAASVFNTPSGVPVFTGSGLNMTIGDYFSENYVAALLSNGRYQGTIMVMTSLWESVNTRYLATMRVGAGDRLYLGYNSGEFRPGFFTTTGYATGKYFEVYKPTLVVLTWDSVGPAAYFEGEKVWSVSLVNGGAPDSFGINCVSSIPATTAYHGKQEVHCGFVFDATLSADQIAYINDNLWGLWHRVSPVFYSIPIAGGGNTVSIEGVLSSMSGTISMKRHYHRLIQGVL